MTAADVERADVMLEVDVVEIEEAELRLVISVGLTEDVEDALSFARKIGAPIKSANAIIIATATPTRT